MRDLICDVVNYCASSFNMGKVSNYKTLKIEKMEIKEK